MGIIRENFPGREERLVAKADNAQRRPAGPQPRIFSAFGRVLYLTANVWATEVLPSREFHAAFEFQLT
jgi:hypothetical protein